MERIVLPEPPRSAETTIPGEPGGLCCDETRFKKLAAQTAGYHRNED